MIKYKKKIESYPLLFTRGGGARPVPAYWLPLASDTLPNFLWWSKLIPFNIYIFVTVITLFPAIPVLEGTQWFFLSPLVFTMDKSLFQVTKTGHPVYSNLTSSLWLTIFTGMAEKHRICGNKYILLLGTKTLEWLFVPNIRVWGENIQKKNTCKKFVSFRFCLTIFLIFNFRT